MPLKEEKSKHLDTGRRAEAAALAHLQRAGLTLIKQNYRCYHGEVDIIMKDKAHLVFVEVRYRHNPSYGNALESISTNKVQKIYRTALHFLQKTNQVYTTPCRFDIIAIHPIAGRHRLQWLKNAFTATI